MKPEDLRLIAARHGLSKSTLLRNLPSYNAAAVTPVLDRLARSVVQKQQAPHKRKSHHKPKASEVDEGRDRRFRITITFGVSDRRERDGDGAESTLLDCLVRARQRLMSLPDGVLMELYERAQKTRGRVPLDSAMSVT
jgi:hypothetical protein